MKTEEEIIEEVLKGKKIKKNQSIYDFHIQQMNEALLRQKEKFIETIKNIDDEDSEDIILFKQELLKFLEEK